jgi:hypothetical protein
LTITQMNVRAPFRAISSPPFSLRALAASANRRRVGFTSI